MKLSPICDILIQDGKTISLGTLPWMRMETPAGQWSGRWVRLVYDAGILGPLTRPVLRVMGLEEHEDIILPAPVFGRAIWTGFIPNGATELRISPVDWLGSFAFRIVSLRTIGPVKRLTAGMMRHPRITSAALLAGMRGRKAIQQSKMQRALGGTPISSYKKWRSERSRKFEWDHFDSPSIRPDRITLRIVVIHGDDEGQKEWARFLASQPFRNASLSWVPPHSSLVSVLNDFAEDDLVIGLRKDDRLADFALASVAQHCVDSATLLYADEETQEGPLFKPDWSPVLAGSAELIGRAWFARARWLRAALPETSSADALLSQLPLAEIEGVMHIRRILLSSRSSNETRRPHSFAAASIDKTPPPQGLLASIIIPTRDRVDLLSPCIHSLLTASKDKSFEIIIVDNGSTDLNTTSFLDDVKKDPRISILHSPDSFNFSSICNMASRHARADTLIFLNNDTEIISGDWISLLVGWAQRPDIGAVGAKLLYGDNTVQHGGVIVGIGGRAAHFERNLPASDAGYFGRLRVPHELSAVTAACMAVSAEKFRSVGGFDEHNLPIDLNDVDLCLRLGERGWRTILEPRALLRHHESASRGKSQPTEVLYKGEIAYFRSRWLHMLRNDPYFHPALSLETQRPTLG